MANFIDLPTEIWILIASYIPKSQLVRLKSLNGLFLNCCMDRSWKELLITREDPRCERILQRVIDPCVATRIRILSIEFYSSSFSPSNISLSVLWQTFTSVPIARMLQVLSLRGNMDQIASLVEYSAHTIPFENLTEFNLTLDQSPFSNPQLIQSSLPLEPFFRSLPPTLQLLNILSLCYTLDWSSLFDALSQSTCYPKLTSLELHFNFNSSFRSSCQSVHRFLLTHNNNLQHLDFYVSTMGSKDEEHLGGWLTTLANNEFQFSCLQTLDICPSVSENGLSAVLTLIKRTAPTLSTLWISFRTLTLKEVKQVVDALTDDRVPWQTTTTRMTGELKSLGMQITQLSVPLLDLLARKLPQLEELRLAASDVVGLDQYSFCDLLHHRRYDPSVSVQDDLHTWNLREFWLFVNQRQATDAMHAVAGAVPSVVLQDEVVDISDDDQSEVLVYRTTPSFSEIFK